MLGHQLIEQRDHTGARERDVDFDGERFPIALVQHVEQPIRPTAVE